MGQGDATAISAMLKQLFPRAVISDDALSALVPVLEEIGGYRSHQIRSLFERQGFLIQEWDKMRRDRVTIREDVEPVP